jgi:hypothetical protein
MKKTSNLLLAIAASTVIVLSALSCKDDEPVPVEPIDYTIGLSNATVHFTSKAESPATITIQSEADWTVDEEIEWISVEKLENALVITAQPSRSLTDRDGVITVTSTAEPSKTAGIQVTQDHGTPKRYDWFLGGIPIEHLSPNGRYAAGEYGESGVVFDLYRIAEEDYQPALYGIGNTDLLSDGSFSLRGVDDSGKPFAKGVTADGTTTVKFQAASRFYTSYLVKNGVSTPLDAPSTYITGSDYKGVYADIVSADGKYILGRINADGGTWISCKWTFDGTNYVFSEIAPDQVDYTPANWKFNQWPEPANINGLSVLGEYSCGAIRVAQGGTIFNPVPAKYMPYAYNMSDESLTVLTEETNARATFVTDDGTLFYATPYNFPFGGERTPYVHKNGEKITLSQWVRDTYGLEVEASDEQGIVAAVAKDYSAIIWYSNSAMGFVNHIIVVEP